MIFLDASNLPALTHYLRQQKWITANEKVVAATRPGEGNMNYVLRIDTGSNSFIIKQSRPYAEKYPSVAAPEKRVLSEAAFYHLIQKNNFLKSHTPYLLGVDTTNNVLAMQDLGNAADYTFLYHPEKNLSGEDAGTLIQFLIQLHNQTEKNKDPLLMNSAMKALNHHHIFIFPFMEENGFSLDNITDGLQNAAREYKNAKKLKQKIAAAGEIYLAEDKHLLHGDYYPGSWLHTNEGIKIIDPEFCFFGPAEFDFGVLLAHCHLSQQTESTIKFMEAHYTKNKKIDERLLHQFTGIEIMRRLIGLAQLPLHLNLQQKKELIQKASELILL